VVVVVRWCIALGWNGLMSWDGLKRVKWSVVVVAKLWVVDGDGMIEWWNRGMEW